MAHNDSRPRLALLLPGGFTLIELLVCVAIVALLAALGAPGLQRQLAQAAVTAAVNQVVAGLHLARRTALIAGRTTSMCLTRDHSTCGFAGREWMIFANAPGGLESRREPGETLLRRWTLPRGVVVSGTRGYAAFLPQTSAAATLTFTFCHEGYPALEQAVVVSQTGRPRVSGLTSTAAPSSRCR